MKRLAIALMMAASAAVVAQAQENGTDVSFADINGNVIGTASLVDTPNGVLFALNLEDLPASQWVAFHVHENGECNPDDNFASAGGHFNPAKVDHGYLSETGPHAGDMPNQYVRPDGTLQSEVFNPLIRLEGKNAISGLALVIHSGADDYRSQPSGDAGARLACAVIY